MRVFAQIRPLKTICGIAAIFIAAIPTVTLAALPDIPRLDWQPRSDWINVKTDVTPAAVGDGRADDTAALQAALDRKATGKTIYLPPGTYRITQTLAFHGREPVRRSSAMGATPGWFGTGLKGGGCSGATALPSAGMWA